MRQVIALVGLLLAGAAQNAMAAPARTGDLEGVWTLGTYTDFQRPKDLKALVLTPAEAEAYEAPRQALHGMVRETDGGVGQSTSVGRRWRGSRARSARRGSSIRRTARFPIPPKRGPGWGLARTSRRIPRTIRKS